MTPKERTAVCNSCDHKRNFICMKHGEEWQRLVQAPAFSCEKWEPPEVKQPSLKVAVVITSHNYGHFLAECLRSVLNQTYAAAEVIVVDDASDSTDITKQVVESFPGVEYLRVENRSAHFSRGDGVQNTVSPIVLFVDADDILPPDYIDCGLKEFTHQDVGVVYADHQHFGASERRTNFPEFSLDRLFKGPNFISTCSLVRREALNLTDAWNIDVDERFMPEDYWLFCRIALDGWEFRKQTAVLKYRRHAESMSQTRDPINPKEIYYLTHGLQYHTVTLFVPLAGRKWMWPRLSAYLERQKWPHDQIKLILFDTGRDPEFTSLVKQWVSGCDYADVRHVQMNVGSRGLADANRRERKHYNEVKQAVCKIYNQLRLMLETPYCWILEDDIIPPDDVLERLLKHFNHDVGAVTAPYQSRYIDQPIVWVEDGIKNIKPLKKAVPPKQDEPQVTEMRGSGFGCLVTRSEIIKQHIFAMPDSQSDLDPYFFSGMGDQWRRLCDWACKAEHWGEDRVYLVQ